MMLNTQAPPYFRSPYYCTTQSQVLGYPLPYSPPFPTFDSCASPQSPPVTLWQSSYPTFSPYHAPFPTPYLCGAISGLDVYHAAVHGTPCKALPMGLSTPSMSSAKGGVVESCTGGWFYDASGGDAVGGEHGLCLPSALDLDPPIAEQKLVHVEAEKGKVGDGVPRCHEKSTTFGTGRRFPSPRHRGGLRPMKEEGKWVWLPKGASAPPQRRRLTLGGATTVMVRNIPNKYSRQMLMEWLDAHCMGENLNLQEGRASSGEALSAPPSEYDFLYLPMDFRTKANMGYAFVNFTSAAAASRLYKAAHGTKWESFQSRKICEICSARFQGMQELMENFRNSIFRCESDEFLPAVFSPPRDGVASPQPPPVTIGLRCDPSLRFLPGVGTSSTSKLELEDPLA